VLPAQDDASFPDPILKAETSLPEPYPLRHRNKVFNFLRFSMSPVHSRRCYTVFMSVKTYLTMADAMRDLERRGFTANFEPLGRALHILGREKTYQPAELTIVEHHRFEGASDPDEMSVVYAMEAGDGTRGVLVDAYGVYSNPDLSAFLKDVRMRENV